MKKLTDHTFNELLRQAVIENFNDEFNALPSNEELTAQYPISDEFEERMRHLFKRLKPKTTFLTAIKTVSKIAAVFTVVVSTVFGLLQKIF